MNSLALKEIGFCDLLQLSHLAFSNLPQNNGIVFALVDTTLSGGPQTDILYLGRANKPAKKLLGGLIAGYGGKTVKRINSKIFNEANLEKTSITWIISDNPRATKKELLSKFDGKQEGYPAWNAQKKLPAKPKTSKTKKKTARPRPARKPVS